jgi:hypothetical protein
MPRRHDVWAERIIGPSNFGIRKAAHSRFAAPATFELQRPAGDYPCKECGAVIDMVDLLSDSGIAARLPKRPCASFCTPAVK